MQRTRVHVAISEPILNIWYSWVEYKFYRSTEEKTTLNTVSPYRRHREWVAHDWMLNFKQWYIDDIWATAIHTLKQDTLWG